MMEMPENPCAAASGETVTKKNFLRCYCSTKKAHLIIDRASVHYHHNSKIPRLLYYPYDRHTMTTRKETTTNPVALSLEEAGKSLQKAFTKIHNGDQLDDDKLSVPAAPAYDCDDPDDMAAAFFAQQARKKQQEAILPINEWAKVIFNHEEMIRKCQEDVIQEPDEKNKEMADKLYLQFQRAVQDGT